MPSDLPPQTSAPPDPAQTAINWRITALATLFVALGPITMSMYAPAMPALATALDTTPAMVQLTLTVYLGAFAVAQLIYGPLSDRFGRKPVLIAGMVIFVGGSIEAALANSIETLLLARFVQAVGACAGPAIARAIVRDLYSGPRAAKVLALVGMALTLAPAVGPAIGGHLQGWFGWRSIFIALGVFGVGVLVAGLAMAETNHRRDPTALDPRRMVANYATLLRDPTYLGYVAVVACTLGGLLAYVAASPFVLMTIVGLSPEVFGWTSMLTTVGYFVGSIAANRLAGRLGLRRLALAGMTVVLVAGLILLGNVLAGWVSVIAIVAPMMLWTCGLGLAYPSAMAGALQPFPHMAGAASAMMGFLQMGAGALGSLAVARLNDGTALSAGLVPAALAAIGFVAFIAGVGRRAETSAAPAGAAGDD
ncbi:MAG: Bcr/CflA family efflux MFS transporter [Alphaproteobacteria bacterium]|jgi:DHA1 family bicyclomycin/chloramphenicol resistance-like MFS transporter|nr:Bcr/CflA family efflux MFS transporter [Alphaproteobacteria bacterium]